MEGLNSKHFASPGCECDAGQYTPEDRDLFAEIKKAWPELSSWGDLAIGVAWGSYTQDVYLLSWLDASQHSLDRSSLVEFIAYIHLHEVGSVPDWGLTPEELAEHAQKHRII